MPIDALLFDKDGTLFDFGAVWNSWAGQVLLELSNGAEAHAKEMAETLRFDWSAKAFFPDSFVIAGTNREVAEALSVHVPQMAAAELERYLAQRAAEVDLAPAVPLAAFLDGLSADGKALGVMTNDNELSARSQLTRAGVLDRFAFVAGFDSGFGEKPDPEPLLAFCHAVDVPPDRTAMVGDSAHDLIAGRAAGMVTIGVLTGPATEADLSPLADIVLPDIGHIPAWLARRAQAQPA